MKDAIAVHLMRRGQAAGLRIKRFDQAHPPAENACRWLFGCQVETSRLTSGRERREPEFRESRHGFLRGQRHIREVTVP